jgi:hypothetical protein
MTIKTGRLPRVLRSMAAGVYASRDNERIGRRRLRSFMANVGRLVYDVGACGSSLAVRVEEPCEIDVSEIQGRMAVVSSARPRSDAGASDLAGDASHTTICDQEDSLGHFRAGPGACRAALQATA